MNHVIRVLHFCGAFVDLSDVFVFTCDVRGGVASWDAYLYRPFLRKGPEIGGSFAERDLQLETSYASSPPCSVPQCHSYVSLT